MISLLRGKIIDLNGNVIVVDINGVGYEVHCTSRCVSGVELDQEVSLVVLTEVREDSIRLYGFEDRLEKQVVIFLTNVQGVGMKTALEIVSKIEKRELLKHIASGDVARLQTIKGIGKKTAERIVVELKDKVADYVREKRGLESQVEKIVSEPFDDAVEALLTLGFSRNEAIRAVDQVRSNGSPPREPGEIVRDALKYI